ncbi:MAG: helix-turn-helix transcriptional regulator, partial [Eubacterium sp.]
MTIFSEALKRKIEGTGMTVYNLAKKAGLNRPMIHKSQQGDKIPSDDFIKKLSKAMMLTHGETEELLQLAARSRMGEALYLRRQAVMEVIACLCHEFDALDIVQLRKEKKRDINLGQNRIIKDSNQIKSYLIRMICDAPKEQQLFVKLPEWAKEYYGIIYHLWSAEESEGIHLTQMIGLEKEYNDVASAARNLKLLSYAINFSLVENREFDAFFHYLEYPEKPELPSFPYYVKNDTGVLAIAADLNTALYYPQGEMYDLYNSIITVMMDESEPLIEFVDNIDNICDYGDNVSLIEGIPCISAVVTDEMVESVVNDIDGRAYIVNTVLKLYHQRQSEDSHPDSFFHLDRLEQFMMDGMIPSISPYYMHAFTPEQRYIILKKYRDFIEGDEKIRYHAL